MSDPLFRGDTNARKLLAGRWYDWRFPKSLEKHYLGDTARERCKKFRIFLLFLMFFSLIFLGLDITSAHVKSPLLLLQHPAVFIICFAAFFLLKLRLATWLQAAILIIASSSHVFVTVFLGIFAPEPLMIRIFFTAVIFVLLQNIYLPLSPREAFWLNLIEILVFNGVIFIGLAILGPQIIIADPPVLTTVMLLSFFAYSELDKGRRKAWFYRQCDQKRVVDLAIVNEELSIVNEELRVLSTTDPLTGVANRRCFDLSLERSWVTSAMLGQPVSLLMLDIDHFKKLNDSLGHAEGDDCLHEAAQIIALNVRNGIDLVARYGGEEFVVILPNAGAELAFTIGERIRKSVEALKLRSAWPLTVSIGVATANFSPDRLTHEVLLKHADRALYQAKTSGRNVTIHAGEIREKQAEIVPTTPPVLLSAQQAN